VTDQIDPRPAATPSGTAPRLTRPTVDPDPASMSRSGAGSERASGIKNPLRSIERYDVVLLASPIWNVRAPMIMSTFAERYEFTGKTVFPVTTYAMSGLGTTPEDYAVLCRAAWIGKGLAVQGEKARSSERAVEAWLRRVGLLTR
jgi:hypothetical protein